MDGHGNVNKHGKASIGTLGERLRLEREQRGIALSEIAAKTRIGARLLQAIESDSYERLPGGIFNKSFIRQYAACLGLDEEQAARDYLRAIARSSESQQASAHKPKPSAIASFGNGSGTMIQVAAAVVVAVAVVLGGYLVHRRTSRQRRATARQAAASAPSRASSAPQSWAPPTTLMPATAGAQTASRSEKPLSSTEPIQPPPQSGAAQLSLPGPPARLAPPAAQLNTLASAGTANSGEMLLQINAHSTVWISVTADGEKKWQGTLRANQSREIQATGTIRLTAGNAGGVSLMLNGRDIGAMGGDGEVKTITLEARALAEPIPYKVP